MSNRMISPLEAEKKWSNFWRFMDLKPLFIAFMIVYLSGTFIVCFGFLRQTSELPIWLSSIIDPFNYHISNNTWGGMGIDWHGQDYTKAEREVVKFICGIIFIVVVIYSPFTIIHSSIYFLSSVNVIWKWFKHQTKVSLSCIAMYSLFLFAFFDLSILTAYMAPGGGPLRILYPLLFNIISAVFFLSGLSLLRRVLVAHGQKQLAAKQGKD